MNGAAVFYIVAALVFVLFFVHELGYRNPSRVWMILWLVGAAFYAFLAAGALFG